MDAMEYNYFTAIAAQPYPYMGFGADDGLLAGVSNDGMGPIAVSSFLMINLRMPPCLTHVPESREPTRRQRVLVRSFRLHRV